MRNSRFLALAGAVAMAVAGGLTVAGAAEAAPVPTRPLVIFHGVGSGLCIDANGGVPTPGAQVEISTCTGTTAQRWRLAADGSVQALGLCLDARHGGTTNGTVVQLSGCNGTAAQQFTLNASRDLVNPAADLCVDVTGRSTAIGAGLQLWTCTGGSNQKWTETIVN